MTTKRAWTLMYRAMRTGRSCQTAAGDYREWCARDFYGNRPEGVSEEAWRAFCDYAEEEADCARRGVRRLLWKATYLNAGGKVLSRYGQWYSVSDYLGAPERHLRIEASFAQRLKRCAEIAREIQ